MNAGPANKLTGTPHKTRETKNVNRSCGRPSHCARRYPWPGMRATIRIVIVRRDDVLHAANKALRYSPDGRTAIIGAGRPSIGLLQLWILRDRGPTAITVQLGLDYGTYTEISMAMFYPSDELIIDESCVSRRLRLHKLRPQCSRGVGKRSLLKRRSERAGGQGKCGCCGQCRAVCVG